jgi:hypothetical protein
MLIDVKYGRTLNEFSSKGLMHFGQMPREGDLVEIDGVMCTVESSWHTPHHVFSGADASILVYTTAAAIADDRSNVQSLVHA